MPARLREARIDCGLRTIAVVDRVTDQLVRLVERTRVDAAPAVDDLAVRRARPPRFRQGVARRAGALVVFHGRPRTVVALLRGKGRHHARTRARLTGAIRRSPALLRGLLPRSTARGGLRSLELTATSLELRPLRGAIVGTRRAFLIDLGHGLGVHAGVARALGILSRVRLENALARRARGHFAARTGFRARTLSVGISTTLVALSEVIVRMSTHESQPLSMSSAIPAWFES